MIDDIKLASVEDIAAMKLAAVTGRGSRKDFVDLFFILEKYTLPQLFDFYRQLYPDGSEFQVLKSLVYFDDAEIEPMPVMIKPVIWEEVKARIIVEVNQHFS
jgi:predicted nucleotidyltransferase component of viral defense system